MSVEYKVELPGGATANEVVPVDNMNKMYPMWQSDQPLVYIGDELVDTNEITSRAVNSTLGFEEQEGGEKVAILRGTVQRLCPVMSEGCGSCALSGANLSIAEMADKNCAAANTARVFEAVDQNPEGRFVLVAKGSDAVYINGSTNFADEKSGGTLMYRKFPDGPSAIFTKSWALENGLDTMTIGMNGADGSFGIATMQIGNETLVAAFCSMRDNMGDRGENKQILRKAINAYLDSLEISAEERQHLVGKLKIDITISASASLKYFAHKIQVPEPGSKDDQRLREAHPELVARAGGKVTSAIVLNDMYPGAFERGAIFPQFEAELGIRETPITPDNCPGDGQTCHIDYRSETEHALVSQLQQMGVSPDNIKYDDSLALDPSDTHNNAASNRSEQINGIDRNSTNRTINGMTIAF